MRKKNYYIYFQAEGRSRERIEGPIYSISETRRLFGEYQMAFDLRPGDHRHGKDHLWMTTDRNGKGHVEGWHV